MQSTRVKGFSGYQGSKGIRVPGFKKSPLSDSINNMFAVISSLHPVSGIHGRKQIVMF